MEINELREEINKIDDEMLSLFEKRMAVAKKIGEYKKENGLAITDEEREKVVIEKAKSAVSPENADYAEEFFRKLIDLSKDCQNKI